MAAYGPTLMLRILTAVFLILFVTQIAHADQEPPITIDQMMAHLGFDKSYKKALLDGKILSTGMPEMEQLEHELAVAAVMLVVKAPMKKVIVAYLGGESFRQYSDMIQYKMVRSTRRSGPAEEEEFKPIGFTEEESSEVKKLLNFKGGETFNFSPDEIKQFQGVNPKDSGVRDRVSLLLRRILVERYRSYLIQGLEAV